MLFHHLKVNKKFITCLMYSIVQNILADPNMHVMSAREGPLGCPIVKLDEVIVHVPEFLYCLG
jgi:hypothetical protein